MADFRKGLSLIPEHMRQTVDYYVIHGIPPGDFLTSLIRCAPWIEVLRRADHTNTHALPAWAQFFYSYMPRSAWGSTEALVAWCADKDGVRTRYLEHIRVSSDEKL